MRLLLKLLFQGQLAYIVDTRTNRVFLRRTIKVGGEYVFRKHLRCFATDRTGFGCYKYVPFQ